MARNHQVAPLAGNEVNKSTKNWVENRRKRKCSLNIKLPVRSDSDFVGGSQGLSADGEGVRGGALLDQPTTSNQDVERERGRGRKRGRGSGGRDRVAPWNTDQLIKVERQLTPRKVAALSKDARQKVIACKRESPLERMLLPDAPPHKHQMGRQSPIRQACIMVDRTGLNSAPTQALTSSIEYQTTGPCEQVYAVASTSSVEEKPTRPYSASAEITIEFIDQAENVEDDDLGKDEAGVNDRRLDLIVEDWLTNLSDNDVEEDDLNVDNFAFPSTGLTAITEPACDSDMTLFQAKVLQYEDDINDQVLRAVVPDDCHTFSWSSDRNNFHGRRETFTGTAGPTFDLTHQTRGIDIFDKMFDVDFIDRLCTETNRYAERKLALLREQNTMSPNSRYKRWSPTDRDITFLTVLILQGLYPLPEEQAYFCFNGYGTMPYFAKTMSYNRFILLKTFLHFVDNEKVQDTTRLYKIQPVIDYFNSKFSSLYMPSQEIVIDESLLKWHGRLNFTQKISTKAAKVGIKTYELCESRSGYLWKFLVYAGKHRTKDRQYDNSEDEDRQNDAHDEKIRDDQPTNVTAQTVLALIEPLLYRGHILIMDNFYNSPLLLRYLKKHNTDCFGTLRLNREFVPNSVKSLTNKTELRKGEVVATYCRDLMILVWRDANIVSMISTYHNLKIGTQDKNNRLSYKPSIVLDYNKSMGGVDRKDQFLSAQPMERLRTKIWYKKLFRRLFNVAIFNCYVIYSSLHQKISHRQFRTTLAEDLVRRHRNIDLTTECRKLNIRSTTRKQITKLLRRKTQDTTQERPFISQNHFPIKTGSRFTCCRMCPKKTRTSWKCEECDVNLCVEGCFKAYHKP